MPLQRITLAAGGLGATLWLVLTLGVGLLLVVAGAAELAEGFRRTPEPVRCDALAAQPPGRWVGPVECSVDLTRALADDGGVWLAPVEGAPVLGELPPELAAVAARAPADAGQAAALRRPLRLEGHLERRGGALVLVPGRPPAGAGVVAFFTGTGLLVWGLVALGRRWLLGRARGPESG